MFVFDMMWYMITYNLFVIWIVLSTKIFFSDICHVYRYIYRYIYIIDIYIYRYIYIYIYRCVYEL